MQVIGYLREKVRLPSPDYEQASGFYVPLETVHTDGTPTPSLSGREDARVVYGVLSEDRSEVCYMSRWGRVSVPYVSFWWVLEVPIVKGKVTK